MLHGVYEDNLRTAGMSAPVGKAPPPKRTPRPLWKSAAGLLVLLFFVAAGVLANAGGGELETSTAILGGSLSTADSILLSAGPRSSADLEPLKSRPTVADLYGLKLRTIVIDAGHGGRDPGAVGQDGLNEKDVTLDVARRLKARLEKYSEYRILLTRDRDEKKLLRDRILFANEHSADLFVSLHVNSLADNSVTPIETYYYGPGSDARAIRLAERENRNSGFSLADFNELTKQLSLEMKVQESREVAHSIQERLYRNMRRLNDEVSDWGAKSGDFMVLLGVEAPSVLVEIGSIRNSAQERMLSTVEYREQLAHFLEEALVDYLSNHANENEETHHASQEDEAGL